MALLIDPAELHRLLDSVRPPRLLDVRWALDRPDGRPEYVAGHLPGAVYVDLETELAQHGAASDGRHPLPSLASLQAAARRWGLDDGDAVVVYDDSSSLNAGRASWMLRGAGVPDVRILDGGLSAWVDAGLPLESGDTVPRPGTVTLAPYALDAIDIDAAAAWPGRGVLIDVRAAARYRGEVEPYDPVAGHIPGAVNLSSTRYVAPDGRFRDAAEIRAAFTSAVADAGAPADAPIAVYCGSGVTAAQAAVAAELAGLAVTVFPGSWSAWSNTPGRPVATGPATA
jgi:thiosulfate/3-mercaptopyruvate sulfurtransferase